MHRPTAHPRTGRPAGRPSLGRHLAPALASVVTAAFAPAAATAAVAVAGSGPTVEELRSLSLEQLGDIEVTSVSKQPQPLGSAAASIYVITNDDIRRSGATSLPEALRLAPNLIVAQADAGNYSISARGFNSIESSNKLLVLIDGRSVYTPLHGGVLWDQQEVVLEDVARIEVISGPGGTLWGANAVNGVINIITKSAAETQGALVKLHAGTGDSGLALRHGGKLGRNGAYRIYGLGYERDETETVAGRDAQDDFSGRQAGFRLDWRLERDAVTLQGDIFATEFDETDDEAVGGNLLGRWTRQLGPDAAVQVQAYYDMVDSETPFITDDLETFDVAAQHSFRLWDNHRVVWGAGYRQTEDHFVNNLNPFVLRPEKDTVTIANLFVEDTIALTETLTATLGLKLEESSYTGLEYLPRATLAWQVAPEHLLWTAVSRATRTPSRIDRDLTFPGLFDAANDLENETLIAYEAGYRGRPTPETTLSVSLFYNDYDDLRVLTQDAATGRLAFDNDLVGETYGAEAWGTWRAADWWRLHAGASVVEKDLRLQDDAIEASLNQHVGNDPNYQVFLRSQMDPVEDVEFDVGMRLIDDLPDPRVPGYVAVDARIGWQVTEELEIEAVGFNLLDDEHQETGNAATGRELRRSFYVGATMRF